MDWSVALGLTKEAPVEPYLQGLQFRELQEKKKIAAAQAAKERQDKLGALLKYDNADIHQSLVNEYTKKANEILLPAMQRFQQGVLTEPEAFQTQAALINLKNQYQSNTKSFREFQANKDIKTAHGKYLQGALVQGTPIEQIYKKSEYEDNPYSRLFTKEGQLDWTNAYSGTINPFEDLEKANKNSIVLKQESKGDYIMETKGIPKDRATLIKSGIYSNTEGIPTWQEMLQEASNRPTFVSDVAATYPKQFYQAEQNAQRAYIETKLKERGIAMNDPNLKNYVTEITNEMQNDPMTLRSLKQKAAVDVGMQYQTGVSTVSTSNPKTTFNFGGGGLSKAGEGKKVTNYFSTLDKEGIHKKVAQAAVSSSYSPQQVLNMYVFPFTQNNDAFANIQNNDRILSTPLDLPPDATQKPTAQNIRKTDKIQFNYNGKMDISTLEDFVDYVAKKENVKPELLYKYMNQVPMRVQTSDMIFKNAKGDALTGKIAIGNKKSIPEYKPVIRYVYGIQPQVGEDESGGQNVPAGGFSLSLDQGTKEKTKIYNILHKYNFGIYKDVKKDMDKSAYDKYYTTEESYTMDKTNPLLSGEKITIAPTAGFE